MNDRFKFRVWDIGNDKFCFFNLEQGLSDRIEQMTNYIGIGAVEQCTGLKDKNGKLVFEGDVICIEAFKRDSCGIYENYLGFVYWDNKNLCWSVKDEYCDLSWFDIEGYDIEVIGNIHQNSELLEAK